MSRQLDYAALREQIPIRRVLELLNWTPLARRGAQWRGPCPFCRSPAGPQQDRCFSVETQRNLFHCFRCRRCGNQLDLWAAVTGLPLYAATLDLSRRLGVPSAPRENSQSQNKD
jgi:DNA primase